MPGPKNIRNGTENPRFQNQNHGRGRRGRNRRTQQRNGGNGNFSGAPDFDRNGNDQNWPVDHRQQTFNHQVRDQSQNSHFQSPLGQPHWDQQNSNQGRRSNGGNRHRNYNDPNNGSFNLQENWQPHNKDNRGRNNRQASNYHAHPSFHSKGIESDLSEIIASASYSQAPLVPFGMLQFIHKDEDIEMPDAPPLEEAISNYAPILEGILNRALQAHQTNVDSLRWQVSNEIDELKRQNRELSDAVICMFLQSRGASPQG
ncbi:hypothetical protein VI817_006917 [Penicillium citrinum]|nr:hypothetical protein VI817_006917 [Penicillium citrinum]